MTVAVDLVHGGDEYMKPTCRADSHSAQDGEGRAREDQSHQQHAQGVEEQARPEQPVDQGPQSAW